ncbi:PREDICTED: rRNA-processing protein UTP23 homolog [Amphimedon queenslandica]|uniref:rRNA-processing protein UTP23 homolog n=1 Tax=Amphimedon queenslandica TaxID=400682 RepID=A0A1X7V9T6_AMPQE|nr:PREDICTED: rRNA-processing protein UTP23 homolog [Amphimedon queenslandica]|eukprot:XP_003385131.1 PREDICTED: rRNA-processing protein UTP23 homolog [Amphimedon queenslandica]
MKVKRCKHAKKVVSFYKNNFGFREPFQIIVDGTFCQAALKGKINIKEQMPKYLCCAVQLVTTKCVLAELSSHAALHGANAIAKCFKTHNCSHSTFLPPADCLDSFIGPTNSKHYCVATQDCDLRHKFQERGGIPLFHIIRNTIVLEKPTESSQLLMNEISLGKVSPTLPEQMEITLDNNQPSSDTKRKRRRPLGPNPLSVKKKRLKKSVSVASGGILQKNKGRRLRLIRKKALQQLANDVMTEK